MFTFVFFKHYTRSLIADKFGRDLASLGAQLGPGFRTWEPESLWELVWLGSVMDTSKKPLASL
jgi:hypothetical protein